MNSPITTDDLQVICKYLDAQAVEMRTYAPQASAALSVVSIALKDCMIAHTKKRIDALSAIADEDNETYDCPIHGVMPGADCPRC